MAHVFSRSQSGVRSPYTQDELFLRRGGTSWRRPFFYISKRILLRMSNLHCVKCRKDLSGAQFSRKQREKSANMRRCLDCIANEQREVQPVSFRTQTNANNSAPSGLNHPSSVSSEIDSRGGARQRNPTNVFIDVDLLLRKIKKMEDDNNTLRSENNSLKEKNGLLTSDNSNLTSKNGDLQSSLSTQGAEIHALYKTRLMNYEDEIAELRRQNEELKAENKDLKLRVKHLEEKSNAQQQQLSMLWKSFERENKIALRELMNKAENLTADSVLMLSTASQTYLSVRRNNVRRAGDNAAHNVNIVRIAEAISCVNDDHTPPRSTLKDIFAVVFNREVDDVYDDGF